jgi:hypothetical protein
LLPPILPKLFSVLPLESLCVPLLIIGGVAAHAFGPGTYTISGNIHLDDGEPWTQSVDPKDGINLLAVAIHEIGQFYRFNPYLKLMDLSIFQSGQKLQNYWSTLVTWQES